MNHTETLQVISGVVQTLGAKAANHGNKVPVEQIGFLWVVAVVLGTIIANILMNSIFNLTVIGTEFAWNKITKKNNQ